jgi:hypothetical protein
MQYKFQTLRKTESFQIYNSLKCIRDFKLRRNWTHVNKWRTIQCNEAGIEGLMLLEMSYEYLGMEFTF